MKGFYQDYLIFPVRIIDYGYQISATYKGKADIQDIWKSLDPEDVPRKILELQSIPKDQRMTHEDILLNALEEYLKC
jgi:hypothetical protein